MSGSVRKFLRDTKGAFAMQFALMAVPLCVCTGLAIDGGRAFLAHYELASALDAAALAAGSTIDEDADLNAVARRFVEMNFKTQHDDPIVLELIPSDDDDVLTLRGSVRINTFFMPLVGQPYVDVSAESEVRRGGNHVEVALALDVTGSMNATRIAGLKAAANALIDEVVSTTQAPYFSKVAVAPWAQSVHVDTDHAPASVVTDLRGELIGSTSISGATWRNGATSTKTISSAGWRTNNGKSISNATWRNGSALSISEIKKVNSNTRIRVRVSASSSTYYTNGNTVYISGANGSYAFLNGNTYKVANRTTSSPYTFTLQHLGTTTYVTPPAGNTNGSSGSSQRCLYTDCALRVTSNSHGFGTGDLVYINNVNTSGGGDSINNSWGSTWTITERDSNNFTLDGVFGPDYANYSSSGTASECYVSDCRYRVQTTANHGFSASDDVFIWNVSESGGGTSLNTATNSSINVESPSGSTFFLPGDARNYKTWSSNGYAAECANANCNVQVTSNGHGLSSGDYVYITGVGGLTGINTSGDNSWPVSVQSSNMFRLSDTRPSQSNMSNSYSSGGSAQCLEYGCEKMRFIDDDSDPQVYQATNCLVERYGANAATDVSPATTGLGILYSSNGSCTTTNYVTPLTSNKTRLAQSITDLATGGSTAGQIGIAWAWYMLSPNFSSVWDKETENVPKAYGTSELAKVAILMTDGEFNYSTCSGVSLGDLDSTAGCNTNSPFQQAQTICDEMKNHNIIIYTVGLELNTSLYSDDFLLACATSPQHAYLAADTDELAEAFKEIATSISKLRLSK